jgi:hypothetical protein
MRTIELLKDIAKDICEKRGHSLNRYKHGAMRREDGKVNRTAFTSCFLCKKTLACVEIPLEGERNISGEAYETNCTVGSPELDIVLQHNILMAHKAERKINAEGKKRFQELKDKIERTKKVKHKLK